MQIKVVKMKYQTLNKLYFLMLWIFSTPFLFSLSFYLTFTSVLAFVFSAYLILHISLVTLFFLLLRICDDIFYISINYFSFSWPMLLIFTLLFKLWLPSILLLLLFLLLLYYISLYKLAIIEGSIIEVYFLFRNRNSLCMLYPFYFGLYRRSKLVLSIANGRGTTFDRYKVS